MDTAISQHDFMKSIALSSRKKAILLPFPSLVPSVVIAFFNLLLD